MARAMVTEWGMSDKVGPIFFGGDQQDAYLGGSSGAAKVRADETSKLIDDEVKLVVETGYDVAKDILSKNLDKLHMVAKALLDYETLTGDEIRDLINGKEIIRQDNDYTPKKSTFVTRDMGDDPEPQAT